MVTDQATGMHQDWEALANKTARYSGDWHTLRKSRKLKDASGIPDSLLELVEYATISPLSAALLMCPVDPTQGTGYIKLITFSVKVFKSFSDAIDSMPARYYDTHRSEVEALLKRIWGL